MLHIRCPKCKSMLTLDPGFRGMPCRCSVCSATLSVPKDAGSSEAKLLSPPPSAAGGSRAGGTRAGKSMSGSHRAESPLSDVWNGGVPRPTPVLDAAQQVDPTHGLVTLGGGGSPRQQRQTLLIAAAVVGPTVIALVCLLVLLLRPAAAPPTAMAQAPGLSPMPAAVPAVTVAPTPSPTPPTAPAPLIAPRAGHHRAAARAAGDHAQRPGRADHRPHGGLHRQRRTIGRVARGRQRRVACGRGAWRAGAGGLRVSGRWPSPGGAAERTGRRARHARTGAGGGSGRGPHGVLERPRRGAADEARPGGADHGPQPVVGLGPQAVSTPSATHDNPRVWASPTITETMAESSASGPRPSTKDRSIFNTSTGKRRR
jgi:hypothetical protein